MNVSTMTEDFFDLIVPSYGFLSSSKLNVVTAGRSPECRTRIPFCLWLLEVLPYIFVGRLLTLELSASTRRATCMFLPELRITLETLLQYRLLEKSVSHKPLVN